MSQEMHGPSGFETLPPGHPRLPRSSPVPPTSATKAKLGVVIFLILVVLVFDIVGLSVVQWLRIRSEHYSANGNTTITRLSLYSITGRTHEHNNKNVGVDNTEVQWARSDKNYWTKDCTATGGGTETPTGLGLAGCQIVYGCADLDKLSDQLTGSSGDYVSWLYRSMCPEGKAALSMLVIATFFGLVALVVAVAVGAQKIPMGGKAISVVLIVAFVFTVITMAIGSHRVAEAKRLGFCDSNKMTTTAYPKVDVTACTPGVGLIVIIINTFLLLIASVVAFLIKGPSQPKPPADPWGLGVVDLKQDQLPNTPPRPLQPPPPPHHNPPYDPHNGVGTAAPYTQPLPAYDQGPNPYARHDHGHGAYAQQPPGHYQPQHAPLDSWSAQHPQDPPVSSRYTLTSL
mmetsp:Transcript_19862/g.46372  ORF Transcript_19862/g.46372 Transcript_19862/m.46372 type:complete len:400 (+) Transcript_19862:31-1230(+)